MAGLSDVFPSELSKLFYDSFDEKNAFKAESDNSQSMLLEVLKNLRINQWNLITSHSFAHMSMEKTVETHFYFEKTNAPPITQSYNQVRSSLYNANPNRAGDHVYQESIEYKSSSAGSSQAPKKPVAPPEVIALLLEKTSVQSGPYGLAKKQAGLAGKLLVLYYSIELKCNLTSHCQQHLMPDLHQNKVRIPTILNTAVSFMIN
jgi:hypothetical protein